jgi:hypothetical protein
MKLAKFILIPVLAFSLSGCSTLGRWLNPFYETPSEVAYFGEKNDRALNDASSSSSGQGAKARQALEAFNSYQRAAAPQPSNPVMMPAIVRLMWVPDHLNSHGDLVPAHYYYLKVKKDEWAVSDAFELESQLNGGGKGSGSAIGYINPEDMR